MFGIAVYGCVVSLGVWGFFFCGSIPRKQPPMPQDGHSLLSVDIGSRNVAYAAVRVEHNGAGETRLRFLAWEVADISGDLVRNAVELAARVVEEHGMFDQVALENQLGRFAARNKTVQSVLHASMLLLCPGCDVVNVSPQRKTSLSRAVIGTGEATEVERLAAGKSRKRSSCVVQKQTVIQGARAVVSEGLAPIELRDSAWMSSLLEGSTKKDDLCDCLMQALDVLERSGHLRLVPPAVGSDGERGRLEGGSPNK